MDRETEIANLLPLKLESSNEMQTQDKISPGEYAVLADVDTVSSLSHVNTTRPDDWHVPPSDVDLIEMLGEGRFGKVYLAMIQVEAIQKCKDVLRKLVNIDKEKDFPAAVKFLNGIS